MYTGPPPLSKKTKQQSNVRVGSPAHHPDKSPSDRAGVAVESDYTLGRVVLRRRGEGLQGPIHAPRFWENSKCPAPPPLRAGLPHPPMGQIFVHAKYIRRHKHWTRDQ